MIENEEFDKNKMIEIDEIEVIFQPDQSVCAEPDYDNINEDKENYVHSKAGIEFDSNYLNQVQEKKKQKDTHCSHVVEFNNQSEKQVELKYGDNNNFTPKTHMLSKKRENRPKYKEPKKNNINNEYINDFKSVLKDILFSEITKTGTYKMNIQNISKLKSQIHIEIQYSTILNTIEKKLQDTISYKDEKIKGYIDTIIANNEYPPFKQFLNEYIKDLLLCFSSNELIDHNKIYNSELKNRYNAIINTLKNNGNSPEYIKNFEKCIENIKKEYENMIG